MSGRSRRVLVTAMVLALVVAACGDDDGATTTAAPSTTGVAVTTTAPWGERVAPGAEAMLEGSRALLREDFQDGDTAGWQVDSGWFVLENGDRRMLGAGGEAWAWYEGGLEWSRYAARLAVLRHGGSFGLSVAVGPGGRYLVHLAPEGVYLLKEAPYGTFATLGSAQPVPLGAAHILAVGVDGGHLQVYVDGVLRVDATDPAPLAGGSVGLGAEEGSSVVVDNIVVASLGGPLPQAQAVGEAAGEPLPADLSDGAPDVGEGLDGGPSGEPGLPNLVISGVSYPMEIAYEAPFDVWLSVWNAGGGDAGGFRVTFGADDADCDAEVEGLGTGEEAAVSCRFPGLRRGPDTFAWKATADARHQVDEGAFEEDNQAAGTIVLGGGGEPVLPDVSVAWTTLDPEAPAPGQAVRVDFAIAQTEPSWTEDLPDLIFRLFYEDGSTACGETVYVGNWTGYCDLEPFAESGEYWLRMMIDANERLEESDEADNTTFLRIVVSEFSVVAQPNLYFDGIVLDPEAPVPGEPFTVTVWVRWDTRAPEPIGLYTIRLLIDDALACSEDTDMASGGQRCYLSGLAAGRHSWAAYIDADDDIAESDEDDNMGFGQFTVEG